MSGVSDREMASGRGACFHLALIAPGDEARKIRPMPIQNPISSPRKKLEGWAAAQKRLATPIATVPMKQAAQTHTETGFGSIANLIPYRDRDLADLEYLVNETRPEVVALALLRPGISRR